MVRKICLLLRVFIQINIDAPVVIFKPNWRSQYEILRNKDAVSTNRGSTGMEKTIKYYTFKKMSGTKFQFTYTPDVPVSQSWSHFDDDS